MTGNLPIHPAQLETAFLVIQWQLASFRRSVKLLQLCKGMRGATNNQMVNCAH